MMKNNKDFEIEAGKLAIYELIEKIDDVELLKYFYTFIKLYIEKFK